MVYIAGEELSAHCMRLIRDRWIAPYVDTTAWEFFDLSCQSRDATDDQVLWDAVEAGARIRAIYKEVLPTNFEQFKCVSLHMKTGSGAAFRWQLSIHDYIMLGSLF